MHLKRSEGSFPEDRVNIMDAKVLGSKVALSWMVNMPQSATVKAFHMTALKRELGECRGEANVSS